MFREDVVALLSVRDGAVTATRDLRSRLKGQFPEAGSVAGKDAGLDLGWCDLDI